MGSFVVWLFYLDGYGVVQGIFVVWLFYLYGYGVVQGIFCCLFVLSWWLWCRSMDLLLFACFTLMVMVSFNGSFVVWLFYLDGYGVVQGIFVVWLFYLYGYGVVQGIFCCLFVLSWWLWCRSMDLLLFACFTLMVMVSFNGSFVVWLFYLDGYGVVQGIFVVWLFYLYGYGVVQGIFCCLFVLSWWLWCRSMDLLLFACFTFMVMVSFKGTFVVCLFYLDGYGFVQGSFCCLFVLPWWLWCRSRELLLFACFTFMVMVSFKGSFVVCLFYLYSYGVVQGIFCCLFVLSL